MEVETLPVHVRYDLPLLQPHAFAAGPIGTSSSSRPRSMSDLSCPSKRSRLNNMASTSEPMGYIFDDSISPSTTNSFQMEISPQGKISTTVAFVLGHGVVEGHPVTKVLLRPLSGRRHQLRLHLSHHGYPIEVESIESVVVGDVTYGSDDDLAPRMMLHAWKLNLRFPPDQQHMYGSTYFQSPDPFESMVNTPMLSTMQWTVQPPPFLRHHHAATSSKKKEALKIIH